MRRFAAFLLVLTLLCGMLCTAQADDAYLWIKSLLSGEQTDSFSLGTPLTMDYEVNTEWLLVTYDTSNQLVTLSGCNAEEAGEVCFWEGIDEVSGMQTVYVLCTLWDALSAQLPEGRSLVFGIVSDDSDSNIWITTAETAQKVVELLTADEE